MAVEPLFDLSSVDFETLVFDKSVILEYNPHRFEFALLDGIVHFHDDEVMQIVGFHQTSADDFWVRGHIPGTPLFPGALMIEAAAQLSSFCYRKRFASDRFFGFGGIDKVKFRGMVSPGERLDLVAQSITLHRRHSRFAVQGFVGGRGVFEGEIVGVSMPVRNETTSDSPSETAAQES